MSNLAFPVDGRDTSSRRRLQADVGTSSLGLYFQNPQVVPTETTSHLIPQGPTLVHDNHVYINSSRNYFDFCGVH